MKLIVGLGNPGDKYKGTRHNIGFIVMDYLAEAFKIELNKNKFNGLYYKGDDFILAKPQTFMNLSGDFVQAISKFYKVDVKDILIIYDDMDHAPGKMALKPTGSAGGQNGMKDIIAKLGTKEIARLKVGIGRSNNSVNHVLGRFSKEEVVLIEPLLKTILKSVKHFLKDDLNKAMLTINTKKKA